MANKFTNIFQYINCPICGNNSFKVVLKFTPEQFLNEERKKYYNLEALEIDWNTNFYIRKCRGCGFVFVNPRLRPELYSVVYNEAKEGQYKDKDWAYQDGDLGRLYNLYNKYREIFPLLNALQYYKKHFEKAKNDGYKHLRLLDYGCGLGHILDLCKVFGIDGTGVEIDLFRLNHCREKGLDARLPEELPKTEKFHIAISTSVVEHIADLNSYFKYISDRLFRNGIFAFNGMTPRIIDIERKSKIYKLVMPLEHINYFTRKTLLRLAEKHGLVEAKKIYGVSAPSNLVNFSYPLIKKFFFKGFYPGGSFEIFLTKK